MAGNKEGGTGFSSHPKKVTSSMLPEASKTNNQKNKGYILPLGNHTKLEQTSKK